jgi:hypothetical protein
MLATRILRLTLVGAAATWAACGGDDGPPDGTGRLDASLPDAAADASVDSGVDAGVPESWGLVMHECRHYLEGRVWCAASVQEAQGRFHTGLALDDFTLTETLLAPDGTVLESAPVRFDEPDYQFYGPGFWERSVTSEMIDLIVLYDRTGSMDDHIDGIRAAVGETLDALEAARVDFRVALVPLTTSVSALAWLPGRFRGVMELAELRDEVAAMNTEGEGWSPPVIYDALLFLTDNVADGLDFRRDADKYILVATDTISRTSYGAHWYAADSVATNRTAVELAYADRDVTILYSVGTEDGDEHRVSYCHADYNPKACSRDGELTDLGVSLGWPLTSASVLAELDLGPTEVVESKYYFAWLSSLDRYEAGENHRIEVTLETADPAGRGAPLTAVGSDDAVLPTTHVVVNAENVRGEPVAFAGHEVYTVMGDRKQLLETASIVNGTVQHARIPCSDVLLWTAGYSRLGYSYGAVRHQDLRVVDPCPNGPVGATFEHGVATADVTALLAQARGLVHDLGDWGVTDKPLAGPASALGTWLDGIDAQGVDATNVERIRRSNVALAGYLNSTHYGEQEIRAAKKNVVDATQQLSDLSRQLAEDTVKLGAALEHPLTRSELLAYTTSGNLDAVEKHQDVRELIHLLQSYVLERRLAADATLQMETIVASNITNDPQIAEKVSGLGRKTIGESWGGLTEAIARLTDLELSEELDDVLEDDLAPVLEDIEANLASVLDTGSASHVETSVKNLAAECLDAFFRDGFSGFAGNFEQQVTPIALAAIADTGSKELALQALDFVFTELSGASDDRAELSNFVLPMVHVVARSVVDTAGGGEVDDDFVIDAAVSAYLHRRILRPHYGQKVATGLDSLLTGAQGYTPDGSLNPVDRESAMYGDYWDAWRKVAEVNDGAWLVLRPHDDIDDFNDWVSISQTVLVGLELTTVAACVYYQRFCGLATEEVPALIAAFRDLRVMTNFLEASLRLDHCGRMADDVAQLEPILLSSP